MQVVVVGAGVMGSAAAWRLAARGHAVTVLERFAPGHGNGSSHGSSRIFRLAYPDPFYVELAARTLPLWRDLEAATGRSVLTVTGGIDHGPPAAIDALLAALRAADQVAEPLTPAQAGRRWPMLRFDTAAVFHPQAGRLHADDVCAALRAAAVARGAQFRFEVPVTGLRRRGDGRAEVVTPDAAVTVADAVVVAAGAWIAPILGATVGTAVAGLPPLVVTREQPLHFAAPDALDWPSFIHYPGAGLPNGPYRAMYGLGSLDGVKIGLHGGGAVIDPEARDAAVDDAALRRVVDYATAWLPGIRPVEPTVETCLYTNTPDEDFVVDRAGPVIVVSACSGHGFKFAPAIGDLAADLVDGGRALGRFAFRVNVSAPPAP